MMKAKPWTPATLKEVGGTEGVGVTFLEETFSATPPPARTPSSPKSGPCRPQSPAPGTGHGHQGQHAVPPGADGSSGYGDRPEDFDDLIRILDNEVRLITPTDPEGIESDSPSTNASTSVRSITN